MTAGGTGNTDYRRALFIPFAARLAGGRGRPQAPTAKPLSLRLHAANPCVIY